MMALGEDVLYLSARELGERIRQRALSPVELTESYLERARRLGPKLGAFATLLPDVALAQARAAEKDIGAGHWRGLLHGVPYAAKDLLAFSGAPTGWGAKLFEKQKINHDAYVIRRLADAGAVLLGKAAMIELAGGMGYRFADASASGASRNPWNQGCWTCGSSSGSAAIVSAALAGFAIGSETWGSIVCPSAFCGISGLRPTYGRISRAGAMALSYSMDKLGPLARSAEDCALILAAIAGHDSADPSSLPEAEATFRFTANGHPPHVGLALNAWKRVPPALEKAERVAADVLRAAGAKVETCKLPDGPWGAVAGVTIQVEGASAFASLIESGKIGELHDPSGKIGGYVAEAIPAADYQCAQRIRSVLSARMEGLFRRFDVLCTLALPAVATRLEENIEEALSFPDPLGAIGNLLGLPAAVVPCGFSPEKLPIGLIFVGAPLADDKVLAIAQLYQRRTDWHRRRPPV
jgi:aspartyl-tRNA(Asn)/glutamyl-tRNA(Gln) amidotransferase subunit A